MCGEVELSANRRSVVEHGTKQSHTCGLSSSVVMNALCQARRQPTPGALSGNYDSTRIDAEVRRVLLEPAPGFEAVVDRGWERMLWR
jgi:hypothetical protein